MVIQTQAVGHPGTPPRCGSGEHFPEASRYSPTTVGASSNRVTAATLTEWRDRFLAGGEAGLKSREVDVEDEEKRRLKSVVAKVSVDNELLREKIARLEDGRPLAFRKWKL